HRVFRFCRSSCDGADIRTRPRRAATRVAGSGGLRGAARDRRVAHPCRSQFQIFPRVPIGERGKAQGGGQETNRTYGSAARAGTRRLVRSMAGPDEAFAQCRPSTDGRAAPSKPGAANALILLRVSARVSPSPADGVAPRTLVSARSRCALLL